MKIESKTITFEMEKGSAGVKEYRIKENGRTIFKFNNPRMTIVFLLKSLFPNEPEHMLVPRKSNPEIEALIEKYLGKEPDYTSSKPSTENEK